MTADLPSSAADMQKKDKVSSGLNEDFENEDGAEFSPDPLTIAQGALSITSDDNDCDRP